MAYKKNILLYPFSFIYGAITGFRNFMFNSGIIPSQKFSQPVICVGNITVGGTGKTPHTEYLIDLLKGKYSVAVLSRGYKRKSRGFRMASQSSNINLIGDEPFQIFRKHPDITVAVDRDRIHGVNSILKERPGTEVIILDDGFQHRRITPGFTILLTDFNRLMTRDSLLPYGELRESIRNKKRADIIVVTKSSIDISPDRRAEIVKEIEPLPAQKIFFTIFRYGNLQHLFGDASTKESILDPQEKMNQGAILVTGIANPLPLKEYLNSFFSEIIHLSFADHHCYTERDIQKIADAVESLRTVEKSVITTEKDAVRLREFTNIAEPLRRIFLYIPVRVHFPNDDKNDFDNLILEYVRENNRNRRIS